MQVDEIGHLRVRAVGARRPFPAAVGARQHPHARLGGMGEQVLVRDHVGRTTQQLARHPVMHVHPAGFSTGDHGVDHLALVVGRLRQDRRRDRIEVPHVVGHVLIAPDQLAGVGVEGDEAVGPAVVAGSDRAVEIGRRVAEGGEQHAALHVDAVGHPVGGAAALPGVVVLARCRGLLLGRDVAVERIDAVGLFGIDALPAGGAVGLLLARLGDGEPAPGQLPVGDVVGADHAADAVFGAAHADDHLILVDDGGHRQRVAHLGVGDLRLPDLVAGLLVEGDQRRVECGHEQVVSQDGDTAVVRPAAQRHRRQLLLEVPQLLARLRVDREHVVVGRRRIHDAVLDDWRRLERAQHPGLEHPLDLELADVLGRDRLGRPEPRLPQIAAIGEPVGALVARGHDLIPARRQRGRGLEPHHRSRPEQHASKQASWFGHGVTPCEMANSILFRVDLG